MNQFEWMQAQQVVQMMQNMPGQEIVITCENEDAAERLYENVKVIIESMPVK